MSKPLAIVVGVGAERGLGAALCRRFAAEGHHVLVAGRTADKIDRSSEPSRAGAAAPSRCRRRHARGGRRRPVRAALRRATGSEPVDLVVSNAGNNRRLDFREVSAATFEDSGGSAASRGFLVGREAARRLVPLGRGTVIFTGASASLRGKPGFAHFAAAKAGLRMWRRAWRGSTGRSAFTSRTSSSMAGSTATACVARDPFHRQRAWRRWFARHRCDRRSVLADPSPGALGMDPRDRPAPIQRIVLATRHSTK